jgi:hypothetical protein
VTPERKDYFDVYFARLGVQKPTVSELVTTLERAGYLFSYEVGGLFIRIPVPETDEDGEALQELSERYPLAAYSPGEIKKFILLREGQR